MDDLKPLRVRIGLEPWERLWASGKTLMQEHRRELKKDDSRRPLQPDHRTIQAMEEVGALFCLGARTALGDLVGYSIWYISPDLESEGLLVGQQAPWFVTEEWRKNGVGLALWREAKRELQRRNVSVMSVHFPPEGGGRKLSRFFEREGGVLVECVYDIWLEPMSVRERVA